MKYLILIITLFTVQIVLGQSDSEYHVKYSLKYKINLNVTAYNEEHFDLIGKNERSFYEGRHKFISDSIFLITKQKNETINVSDIPRTNFYSSIFKYNDKIVYQDVVAQKSLFYKENAEFKWKYSQDSIKNVNGYKCKMATTKYGGRNWKAWFTTDIPIQNGPFKFSGLPGLILEISDSENHYIFQMLSVTFKPQSYNSYDARFKKENGNKVTREEYIKIRNKALSSWDNYQKASGVQITNEDPMVSREISNKMKAKNNFIELE